MVQGKSSHDGLSTGNLFFSFRQSNTDLPREHYENVPLTSPTATQPRLPPRKDSNFLIAPFKMEKIKKNLDVVFELRKLESVRVFLNYFNV